MFCSLNFLWAAILNWCVMFALQRQTPTYSLLLLLSRAGIATTSHISRWWPTGNSIIKTKKWQETENRIFPKDWYYWWASLALQYHFYVHFPRKILILSLLLSFLNYVTLRIIIIMLTGSFHFWTSFCHIELI